LSSLQANQDYAFMAQESYLTTAVLYILTYLMTGVPFMAETDPYNVTQIMLA